jgi:hypothetical protein
VKISQSDGNDCDLKPTEDSDLKSLIALFSPQSTAIIYFRKFYSLNNLLHHDPRIIM